MVGALKSNTVLITIQLTNGETGVLQPVDAVGQLLREQECRSVYDQVHLHTDAAQALGKVAVTADWVDSMTIAGHKFYGPRIGALFVRNSDKANTPFVPLFIGGGQERGRRAG